MDRVDAIISLKNCYQELEEIDKNETESEVSFTKTLIAKKMHEIAGFLYESNLIPTKANTPSRLCKIHNHPGMERRLKLDYNHVVIDTETFNLLWDHWGQIEKLLKKEK